MAKIHGHDLSAAATEYIIDLVQGLPESETKDLGKALNGGFTKPAIIRERLAGIARSAAPLPKWFVDSLCGYAEGRELVAKLSLEALKDLGDTLSTLLGVGKLHLALVLDERENVRKFGFSLGLSSGRATAEDKNAARDLWLEFVNTFFFRSFGIATSSEAPPACETVAPSIEHAPAVTPPDVDQNQNKRLRAVLKALRKRFRERAREQQQKSKQELERQKKIAESLSTELATAKSHMRDLESQLAEREKGFQAAVEQGMRERTSEFVRPWLQAPRETKAILEETNCTQNSVLKLAQEALQAQAREDEYTGNRLQLEKHVQDLCGWRERLAAAAKTAIHPLASTTQALAEVEKEISRIEKRLNRVHDSPLLQQILIKANHVESPTELSELSKLAQELRDKSLLSSTEAYSIIQAIHRKYSILEDKNGKRANGEDAGWVLRSTIRANTNSVILLDGHNIVFGLKDLFEEHYENGVPGSKARRALVDWIVCMVRNYAAVQARIYFDAPKATFENVIPNVRVEFSGGEGAHRADNRIEAYLQFLRTKSLQTVDHKVFVVTNDIELRRSATKLNAVAVSIESFAVLLTACRSGKTIARKTEQR